MTAERPASGRRRRRLGAGVLVVYAVLLIVSHVVRADRRRTPPPLPAGVQAIEVPVVDRDAAGSRDVADPEVAVDRDSVGEEDDAGERGAGGDTTVRLAFADTGNPFPGAPVVILLHGSPGDLSNFSEVLPHLASRARVVVPDLPGFGHSEHRIPDYSIRAHAHYLNELTELLDIESAHCVGFSMGGGVVLELDDRWPDRVASLTMLGSIGAQELELLGSYALNHLIHGAQLAGVWLLHETVPHMGALDRFVLDMPFARNFWDTDQRPLRGMLEHFEPPLLIIHGRHDPLVPVAAALEHHRIVPHSELFIFEERSHFLVWTEPARVADLIASFAERVEEGAALTRQQAGADRLVAAAVPWDEVRAQRAEGLSFVVLIALIVLGTFISEDLTCIATGLLIARGRLDWEAGLLACFLGIYLGDQLLYVAGRVLGKEAVRRAPWSWFIHDEALHAAARWFEKRGLVVVFLSRFVPGTRLPTYVLAGMVRANYFLFAAYFFLAVLVWTPALVGLAVLVGRRAESFLSRFHESAPIALLLLAALILLGLRIGVPLLSHRGRRLLVGRWRRLTQWEYWPVWVFYIPVVGYIVRLMIEYRSVTLVTAANPAFPAGGIIGESKYDILRQLDGAGEAVARAALIAAGGDDELGAEPRIERVRDFMRTDGLEFPIVLKPDVGQRGSGVHLVRDDAVLARVVAETPVDLVAQEFAPGVEFGIFYVRLPSEPEGSIFSITEKVMPVVTGDGVRALEELIFDDRRAVCMAEIHLEANNGALDRVPEVGERIELVELGTHCRGAIFRDGWRIHTPELEAAIDRISRAVDGFYFGRYDVRAPTVEALSAGRDFKIVELNGLTSEATHIYDPAISLRQAYGVLFQQWRLAFRVARESHERGARTASIAEVVASAADYRRLARLHA